MKLKQVSVSSIEDRDFNPNKMDADDYGVLLEQVKRFKALTQPPLLRDQADGSFLIVDGHHRMQAAREAGLTKVHAVVLDQGEHLDDRILQVSMNKLRGRLDLTGVAQLAEALTGDGVPMEDIALMGYSVEDLNEFISTLTDSPIPDLDDVKDLEMDDEDRAPKPFVLEITFANRDDYKACRKALKRITHSGELADGLMAVLGLDEE